MTFHQKLDKGPSVYELFYSDGQNIFSFEKDKMRYVDRPMAKPCYERPVRSEDRGPIVLEVEMKHLYIWKHSMFKERNGQYLQFSSTAAGELMQAIEERKVQITSGGYLHLFIHLVIRGGKSTWAPWTP